MFKITHACSAWWLIGRSSGSLLPVWHFVKVSTRPLEAVSTRNVYSEHFTRVKSHGVKLHSLVSVFGRSVRNETKEKLYQSVFGSRRVLPILQVLIKLGKLHSTMDRKMNAIVNIYLPKTWEMESRSSLSSSSKSKVGPPSRVGLTTPSCPRSLIYFLCLFPEQQTQVLWGQDLCFSLGCQLLLLVVLLVSSVPSGEPKIE